VSKFEEIRKRLRDSVKTPEDLSDLEEVLESFGLTPDNPEGIREVIEEAGILEDVDLYKADETVKNMVENLSPEMKKQMAELITRVSNTVSDDPIPDDVKNLLDRWKEDSD